MNSSTPHTHLIDNLDQLSLKRMLIGLAACGIIALLIAPSEAVGQEQINDPSVVAPPQQPEIDAATTNHYPWRDPFWPVGYVPPPPTPTVDLEAERRRLEAERQRQEMAKRIEWPSLTLTGITHAGNQNFIAVIEGIGLVEQGDIVSIHKGDLIYQWRINQIKANGITSTRLGVSNKEMIIQR